jgi:hypothetical protein
MPDDFNDPRAISYSREAGKGRRGSQAGCLILFFGLFFVIGFVASYFLLFVPLWKVYQADRWVKTPCVITSSRVESHAGDEGGTTYSIAMEYDYSYEGRPHHGNRYNFGLGSSSGRKGKQDVVDQYPAGSKRECFVNPLNPSESVINRNFTGGMWFGLIPLIFVLVGLIGIGFGVRSWIMPKATKLEIPNTLGPASSWSPESLPQRDLFASSDLSRLSPDGFVTLSTSQSGLAGCLVLLVIAGIWNTVVGFFLSHIITSFQRGRPEWFMTFFSIPFVIVGALLLYGIVYTFLKLFNPRPVVAVRPGKICLGQSMTLRWRFTGQTNSIRQLKVELIGKERATYRRGTSTYTDEEVFATLPVMDTSNPMEISSGEQEVSIPADSMHSFKSSNNEISWGLRIDGDIAWWPNVNETYPIAIEPIV